MNEIGPLILTTLGGSAFGAIVVAIITTVSSRDSRKADVANDLSEAASKLIGPISAQLEEVRNEVGLLKVQNRQVLDVMDPLVQIVDLMIPIIETEHPELAHSASSRANKARRILHAL